MSLYFLCYSVDISVCLVCCVLELFGCVAVLLWNVMDVFTVYMSPSPSAWFAQAEAQFAIRYITQDDTRYSHVVSALDSSTATRVLSLLISLPNTGKHEAIKTLLLTSAYDFPTMRVHPHCLD